MLLGYKFSIRKQRVAWVWKGLDSGGFVNDTPAVWQYNVRSTSIIISRNFLPRIIH